MTGTVPLRILSGRHVEAAGTEDRADAVRRPLRRLPSARRPLHPVTQGLQQRRTTPSRKFRDRAFCRLIAGNAYEVATTELTYTRLIDRFAEQMHTSLGLAA